MTCPYFSYRYRRGPLWFELWYFVTDGVLTFVRIEYRADWWSREGSIADLRGMAIQAAQSTSTMKGVSQ